MARATRLSQQQGAALLLVLMVVAIVSVMAVAVSERTQTAIRLADSTNSARQAAAYLAGAELRAKLLIEEAVLSGRVDLSQRWAKPQLFEIEGGTMGLQLQDLSSCFNLNIIAEQLEIRGGSGTASKAVQQLTQLMQQQGISHADQQKLVARLTDWVDPDTLPTGSLGAEDLYYTRLAAPYRAANSPLVDLSELRLMEIDADLLAKMGDALCVRPLGTGDLLNVNTVADAKRMEIVSLGQLTQGDAQNLIDQRPEQGYATLAEFVMAAQQILPEESEFNGTGFSTLSYHFRGRLSVEYQQLYNTAEVEFVVRNNKVEVLRRNIGERF